MCYEAEEADAADNHGQDDRLPCLCDWNFTCRACLDRATERAKAERYIAGPPATYVGAVMFGEAVIQQEGQPLSESYPLT